ncbi:1-acyl-sn-glycerol-3-phosphate acyltransferase [Microbispora camponoti]|uniref:1-acyl-sn-glycerol-3-phosphate acyltransferase n=1 Tax=Microbispora bryophytorum subsp. camponoti TaxID=1677852 RepID=A0ABR8KX23_9ACTN|nr:1-acyl-sn-glycerol-3-phosphate acyltransferase [Microbispora camponoti]
MPTSPCVPDVCLRAQARRAGPLRRAARMAGAAAVLLAGLPIALALGRSARRGVVTMLWSRLLLRALGVRLVTHRGFSFIGGSARVRAVPGEDGPALLVANHVSWLDPLVITATAACRPLAKAEVGRWPIIRTLAGRGGALFIDRDRLSALPGVVADMTAALRRGESVAAFPEGTTWCGREMGRFRPAVFQAALDAGVPVRPVALRFLEGAGVGRTTGAGRFTGQRAALSTRPSYVGDDTLLASVLRIVATRDLVAEVTVFPAVRPDGPVALGGPVQRRQARTALARIAEAQVRTGLVTGLVEPGEQVVAA